MLLTPGPHDFAVRICTPRLRAQPRPPHPAPNVRDDRETPLCSRARDARIMDLIWAKREAKYFCGKDWTGRNSLIGFDNFAFRRRGPTWISVLIFSPPSFRGWCEAVRRNCVHPGCTFVHQATLAAKPDRGPSRWQRKIPL
jgi:hypothetical protein